MPLLTPDQKQRFAEDGYLLLRGFYEPQSELAPIQRSLYEIIGLLAAKHGLDGRREAFRPERFDAGYQGLIARDRAAGGEVYDAAKLIPAFHRLLCSEKNEQLFGELRGTDLAGIGAASFGIRIDNPREEQFRSHWHQEFLFQPQSLDGLVFWSPLVPVEENMGPVQICVGSQRHGLCIYRRGDRYANKPGAYQIGLADEAATVARYEIVAPLVAPGDLLILDYLTLHQSGYNVSERSRWSMQFRLFNFRDPVGQKLGWKPSVTAGTDIESLFPDRFAS
jgi:hypothetical protein